MNGRLRGIWPPVLIAVVVIGAWQLLVVTRNIQPLLLPSPSLIASNFLKALRLMWGAAFYSG